MKESVSSDRNTYGSYVLTCFKLVSNLTQK